MFEYKSGGRAVQPVPWDLEKPLLVPLALVEALVLRSAPKAVPCGFPSPAQDYWAGDLDLAQHLIRDRASTFIWRASGHSMTAAGIHDRDLLLVDRGIRPGTGHVVVAIVDGEYTIKRLDVRAGRPVLRAESPGHPDVTVAELSEVSISGVVTWVLHRVDAGPSHQG